MERHAGDVPVYLETGSESMRDGCRRRGYDVLAELDLPGGGPRTWTLLSCPVANLRDARLADAAPSR